MILKWIRNNWILILILLIGAFFRLYKIDQYMTFLGDEGRDSIIVRNLLVHADPILIGPGTSVGGMYLGPLYYYFMAPFLLLSNFSPVGPSVGVALLGIATIYLLYVVCMEWFSKNAGLVAASLFAISPTAIIFSHSSWNPNIMPFFSLLSVYSIWRVWKKKEYKWLFVTGLSFAFVLQSHYLGLLMAPVLFIFWLISKVPKKYTLISASIFLFLMSPLLIFDIRHDWMNTRALYKFVTVRDSAVSVKPLAAASKVYPIFEQISSSMLTAKNEVIGGLATILLTVFLVFIFTKKKSVWHTEYSLLLGWLIFGLLGFGLYRLPIFDHYFGFLFAVPFLVFGAFVEDRLKLKNKIMNLMVYSIFLVLIAINLMNNPFTKEPNRQMQRAKDVSLKVLDVADEKPFNLAVLAETNYEDGYRYFMELAGAQVMHADRWDQKTIVDTLMVICEREESKCDPTHSPKAEIANFGWSKIEDKWVVDGVIIYKLIHSK